MLDTTNRKPGAAPKLLLIDDDPNIRESLQAILMDEGFEVTAAANGSDALEIMEAPESHYTLVIMDWYLPTEVRGYNLLDSLRDNNPNVGVIVLSGDPELVDTLIEGEPAKHTTAVQKPITDFNAFIRLIRSMSQADA